MSLSTHNKGVVCKDQCNIDIRKCVGKHKICLNVSKCHFDNRPMQWVLKSQHVFD